MSQPKVCLGNINPGQLSVGFVDSLIQSNNHHLFHTYIIHPNGPYLDMGRNVVAREFLKTDCDYLLFIDSDISWTVQQLKSFYRHLSPKRLLGGYYLNPYYEGINPVVYEWKQQSDDEDDWLMASITEAELLSRAQPNGLAPVTSFGTGFMCIPRQILEAVGAKWTKPCEYFAQPIYRGIHLGEDLAFCLRVADVGYPLFVDTRTKVQHTKTVKL